MSRSILFALVCVLALGLSGSRAQSEKGKGEKKKQPEQGALEEMYERALRNNADIRVAEAKLREADAELNRIRQQVLHKIFKIHHEIDAAKALVDEYKARYDREVFLFEKGADISPAEVGAAKATLEKSKADYKTLEAQLPYLLGQSVSDKLPAATHDDAMRELVALALSRVNSGAPPSVPQKLAEAIRKALDTPVKAKFKDVPVAEAIANLKSAAAIDVNIHFNLRDRNLQDKAVNADFSAPVPLGAALQWFEDQFGWRFVLRSYGIVICDGDNVPPGALLLQDFWKTVPSKNEKK